MTFEQKLSAGMLAWASVKSADAGASADEHTIADSIVRQNSDFPETRSYCSFWCYAKGLTDDSTQAEFDTETENAINATLGIWTAGRP